jgi:hypothetical protein
LLLIEVYLMIFYPSLAISWLQKLDFLSFMLKIGYFIERMKRWYTYMKYIMAKAVRSISNVRMAGLLSIAIKYPCCSMSVKTRVWRNIAPPKQLKPKMWKSVCILLLSFWSAFIIYREY